MIIVLKREATQEIAQEILGRIDEKGLKPLYMPGSERVVLGALGDERVLAELEPRRPPDGGVAEADPRRPTSSSAARCIRTTRSSASARRISAASGLR